MSTSKRVFLATPDGKHPPVYAGFGPFQPGAILNFGDKVAYRVTGSPAHGIDGAAETVVYPAVQIRPDEIPFERRYPFVTERDR